MPPVSAPAPERSLRRRVLLLAGVLLLGAFLVPRFVLRVGPAEVGIRIKLAGSERGVDDIPLITGWTLYNPIVERVVVFPTSIHTTVWTQDAREGSPTDDSITFSSREGVNMNADFALSFHITKEKAPHLYQRFRKDDLEELADGYVRNTLREALNICASQRTAEDIYGTGKTDYLSDVRRALQEKVEPDGIHIDQLTLIGALRLPENVARAIDRTIEATQRAIEAENKLRQVRAEAQQALVEAEGQARATRTQAQGNADARLLQARAEARANLLIRHSVSPAILQHRALERWDGKMPVMYGATPER